MSCFTTSNGYQIQENRTRDDFTSETQEACPKRKKQLSKILLEPGFEEIEGLH